MSAHVHYDLDTIKRQMLDAQEGLYLQAVAKCRDEQDRAWMEVQHRLWQATVPAILAVFEEWNLGTDEQMVAKGVAMVAGNLYGFFAVNASKLGQLRLGHELPVAINKAMNMQMADFHTGLDVAPMQGSRA